MKKIPIGISSFEEIITNGYYYIDKTLLVKELLDNGAKATLIPRPRRFGKTLNISMLQCFFEKNNESKKHLFDNLSITQYAHCMEHQGQYPVIFFSFKDAKAQTWDECREKLVQNIQQEFIRHTYLAKSTELSERQKNSFASILDNAPTTGTYKSALRNLCEYLALHHKRNPIVLIDEYDSPIHAGFVNNYYNDVVDFMRGFLGEGLKDNSSLNFAVITGILRVAKESIFSGLNNLHVCTLLNNNYADKFGLLENEVSSLFQEEGLSSKMNLAKEWYNGYTFGRHNNIYNPWSVINFLANKGDPKPYWINTSDNAIIKEVLTQNSSDITEDIELLLKGETLEKEINENIIFSLVHSDDNAAWSFLLLCGYLSSEKTYLRDNVPFCSIKLPNQEVTLFYRTVVLEWIKRSFNIKQYQHMLQALTTGDMQAFKIIFYDMVKVSLSSFDTAGDEPERFYHALVIGMLVSLREHYEVNSNRESGYGRYDVMIIPRKVTPNSHGIIIEFKKVNTEHPTLEKAVIAGLKQIEDKAYEAQLRNVGIKNIVKVAIAFEGKKALVQEAE